MILLVQLIINYFYVVICIIFQYIALIIFNNIKKYTNGLRNSRRTNRSTLWKKESIFCPTLSSYNKAGRNNTGSIVFRRRGTRCRNRMRLLYNTNTHYHINSIICRVEYDPNRSSFISLLFYLNGFFCYTLNTLGSYVGSTIHSYIDLNKVSINGLIPNIQNGDTCFLYNIPVGSVVNNIELVPFCGGTFSRSAGTCIMVLRKFVSIHKAYILLPSRKYRSISFYSHLIRGVVSNNHNNKELLGKAGIHRLKGIHPVVRGVAKNPIDHPHGGGEGKKSKKCHPRTAWGRILHWRKTGVVFTS